MTRFVIEEKLIEIHPDVQLTVEGQRISVKGPKGELQREFIRLPVTIIHNPNENTITVRSHFGRHFEMSIIGTVAAHIQNMITGVTKGFEYKLKIISSHFPMTVQRKESIIIVKNHYGERAPKFAKIVGDIDFKVVGDDIILTGINKEDLGQTAANIQNVTRLRGKRRKDPTTFQDGIYVFEKT